VQKKVMAQVMEKAKQQIETRKRELEAQRQATSDADEIAAIDQQLAALDKQVIPDPSVMLDEMFSDAVMHSYLFEGITAMILFLAMFVAGCGMFGMAPWARKLGIAAAIGRIATAVVFAVLNVVVIMPQMAEGLKKMQEIMSQVPGAPQGGAPMPNMGPAMMLQGGIGSLIGMAFNCAWPVALLIMLNTKPAKQAFGVAGDDDPGASSRITMVPK